MIVWAKGTIILSSVGMKHVHGLPQILYIQKADRITTRPTAEAVTEVGLGIHRKGGLLFLVERTEAVVVMRLPTHTNSGKALIDKVPCLYILIRKQIIRDIFTSIFFIYQIPCAFRIFSHTKHIFHNLT